MDKINRMYMVVLILSGIMPLAAQDNAERYTTISGVVKDKLNKKKLEYVNVSIPGSSVGTVTNADGEFTLKIPESVQAKDIEASHVGYLNSRIPLKEENPTERIVWLTPYANLLSGNPGKSQRSTQHCGRSTSQDSGQL